ncbi:MAG: transcription elongation factor GreA [Armatimonadota bacterium]|nr:transcription elongation factor GreA [Armatimonadota bacterium]MDW8025810.1 transcription elongation factor GreA [Armatimonadota bacterium]
MTMKGKQQKSLERRKRRREEVFKFEPSPEVIYMTEEGKESLEGELHKLLSHDRKHVLADIRESRRMGEFIEDSDYDDAKKEQALIEGRIQELQEILRLVRVVPKRYVPTDRVGFGTIVELEDLDTQKRVTYQIVGPFEADPLKGRISYESPLGERLMGKRVGDIVEVRVPVGLKRYKVVALGR